MKWFPFILILGISIGILLQQYWNDSLFSILTGPVKWRISLFVSGFNAAPSSNNKETIYAYPSLLAEWSGVDPYLSLTLMSAPCSNNNEATSWHLHHHRKPNEVASVHPTLLTLTSVPHFNRPFRLFYLISSMFTCSQKNFVLISTHDCSPM